MRGFSGVVCHCRLPFEAMRSWAEAVLAMVVIVALGTGLFLFTGESLGGDSTDTTTPVTIDAAAAARGQTVAESAGCLACHTVDGADGTGPTWKGLYQASRPLTTGESVVADDTYLEVSTLDPGAQVVLGYDNVMQSDPGQSLTEEELADLIEYIKSLA